MLLRIVSSPAAFAAEQSVKSCMLKICPTSITASIHLHPRHSEHYLVASTTLRYRNTRKIPSSSSFVIHDGVEHLSRPTPLCVKVKSNWSPPSGNFPTCRRTSSPIAAHFISTDFLRLDLTDPPAMIHHRRSVLRCSTSPGRYGRSLRPQSAKGAAGQGNPAERQLVLDPGIQSSTTPPCRRPKLSRKRNNRSGRLPCMADQSIQKVHRS